MVHRYKLFLISFLLIALQLAPARANDENTVGAEIDFFGGAKSTSIRNIDELRDPFKRPTVRGRQKQIPREPRSNFIQNIPSIEGVPLNAIRIVGILLGEERRAIAKVVDFRQGEGELIEVMGEESYVLKEGMRIGENKAEIKAILPGGIVLVEKIRNIYDQDEYLETIIPLTLQ